MGRALACQTIFVGAACGVVGLAGIAEDANIRGEENEEVEVVNARKVGVKVLRSRDFGADSSCIAAH